MTSAGTGQQGSAGGRASRGLVAAGALAAVVVIALVVFLLTRGSDEKDSASPTTATPSAATPSDGATGDVGTQTVLAHQGGSEKYPLETLPAFLAAVRSGAAAEMDVHWTSDGVAVLVHDDETTPADEASAEHPMICRGGPYRVSQTRWSVLRERCRTIASASTDGRRYPVPTYDETIKAVAAVPGAQVVAEMKPVRPSSDQVTDYLAAVTKYDMADRLVASSFSPDALTALQDRAKQANLRLRFLRMLRPSADEDLPTPEELGGQGLWGVALRSDIVTGANVTGLHAQKLTVAAWTVDTPALWGVARTAGVDLVLTNKPDGFRKWRTTP